MQLARNLCALSFLLLVPVSAAYAHCQIPCGIYGDEMKFAELQQHVATIEKAGAQIRELAGKESRSPLDAQQLVRWTVNKEDHAQRIIDEAANYFLAQRIKAGAPHYAEQLQALHLIIVNAMKAKQSPEAAPAAALRDNVAALQKLYLDKHDHKH